MGTGRAAQSSRSSATHAWSWATTTAGMKSVGTFADKATPVRKPLMVLGTLPRVLGPGESVDLPVTVFAMEKWVKDVNVQIIANDLFEPVTTSGKSLHFTQVGDDIVNFKLKVKSTISVAKVKIIATSGKERAETSIELDVRNLDRRFFPGLVFDFVARDDKFSPYSQPEIYGAILRFIDTVDPEVNGQYDA